MFIFFDIEIVLLLSVFEQKLFLRQVIYYKNFEKLFYRWMSPETLISNTQFSSKSDVWSFGVLIWELFTYSTQYTPLPYSHLKDEEVLVNILRGQVLSCPQKCPKDLFCLMQKCWIRNILKRPTFMVCL